MASLAPMRDSFSAMFSKISQHLPSSKKIMVSPLCGECEFWQEETEGNTPGIFKVEPHSFELRGRKKLEIKGARNNRC